MAPENRTRDSDGPKSQTDYDAERAVYGDLREKQPTETRSGIVERGGRALEIVCSGQADQPVPEVFPLDEDEDHEDDDDAGGRKWVDQGRQNRAQVLERAGIRLSDLDRDRRHRSGRRQGNLPQRAAASRRRRVVQLLAQVLEHVGSALERTAPGRRAPQRIDLLTDGRLILGKLAGEIVQLCCEETGQA
jgi:hypothetical protein